ARARGHAALVRGTGTCGRGPARSRSRGAARSREGERAPRRRSRGRARRARPSRRARDPLSRRALRTAVGRLPLLLRRSGRVSRRDRAACMKAVVLHEPGKLGVDEVADPTILQPGDAIVSVRATAICGADLFPFHGMTPGFELGTILGHEFAGEVVAVGSGVTSLRPGARVVNASMISDGTCPSCRAGRVTQCEGRSLFGYSGVY